MVKQDGSGIKVKWQMNLIRALLLLFLSGCVVTELPQDQLIRHHQSLDSAHGRFYPYSYYEEMYRER